MFDESDDWVLAVLFDISDLAREPELIKETREFSRHLWAEDHELVRFQAITASIETFHCPLEFRYFGYDLGELFSREESVSRDVNFEIVALSSDDWSEEIELP